MHFSGSVSIFGKLSYNYVLVFGKISHIFLTISDFSHAFVAFS